MTHNEKENNDNDKDNNDNKDATSIILRIIMTTTDNNVIGNNGQ